MGRNYGSSQRCGLPENADDPKFIPTMKFRLLPMFILAGGQCAGAELSGLAAKYPGDAGLAADPDVVFVENFETEALPKSGERWNEVKNEAGAALALAKDSPPGSSGKQSLQVTATHGQNTGGHLFKVLKPGYDELYLRFYVKFAADHGYLNHFVKLQGSINPPNWPEGEAGFIIDAGDDCDLRTDLYWHLDLFHSNACI